MALLLLKLDVAPQEITEVAPFAVFKQQKISFLFMSVYDYRVVPLERVNLNDIWMTF